MLELRADDGKAEDRGQHEHRTEQDRRHHGHPGMPRVGTGNHAQRRRLRYQALDPGVPGGEPGEGRLV